ncbi:ABC transporter ATP-binding protein [Gemmiger formicilis]|uniref:ABC transporter ATP-binding protein n=1 Tax=Gemmiger formicilis TaxID=745368 RepID=UPI0019566E77|nr:ABC transporter ATP-binding protein [Gemmiger formicilis]MBM6916919.1 ABC transporter ATP-binding protein [Gemmiger formicilis]HIX32735.1 ABC transporter ATP-binding protein/permease [Candidatus Gemmiger avium]
MTHYEPSLSQGQVLLRVLRRVGRYWFWVLASLVLAAVTVVLTLWFPILTGQAVDQILGPGQVDFAALPPILIAAALAVAGTAVSQWLMGLCNNHITYCVIRDMRRDAFGHLQQLNLRYLDSHPTGGLVSRIIADVDQFADGLLMGFTQLFTGILTILGTLICMLTISPLITVVVVAVTPVSLFVAAWIARSTYFMFRRQSDARAEQTSLIDEMVSGQKVVQAFGQGPAVQDRFDEINGRLTDASFKATFFSSLTNPATRFVNSLVYTGAGLTGALCAIGGLISVGQLSTVLSYANQYTKPFNEISGVVTELQNALACAGRIFELLEAHPQRPDDPDALVLENAEGKVELENIYFSYDKSRPLIEGFDLTVQPGQRVAIVGPTGCGKTTLINLLMRFYEPDAGQIRVDGHPVRQMTRRSLRRSYGMVLQDTWLRAGTIRENIAMGRPDASLDEVIAAAKASHAHSFIKRLPQGYDTMVNEDGGMLSQGQKQLLCIARVMLNLPPMLILDEATSSIDTRTEQKIQSAFARLMQGRTSFIVAHRLSTIREADVILVMRDGHVVEQGTHDELLAQNGFYANLWNSQFVH